MTLSLITGSLSEPPFDFDIKEQSLRLVTFETYDHTLQVLLAVQTLSETALYLPMYVGPTPKRHFIKELSKRLVTFETFDQSHEKS